MDPIQKLLSLFFAVRQKGGPAPVTPAPVVPPVDPRMGGADATAMRRTPASMPGVAGLLRSPLQPQEQGFVPQSMIPFGRDPQRQTLQRGVPPTTAERQARSLVETVTPAGMSPRVFATRAERALNALDILAPPVALGHAMSEAQQSIFRKDLTAGDVALLGLAAAPVVIPGAAPVAKAAKAAKLTANERRSAALLSLNQRARSLLDRIPEARARIALPTIRSIQRFGDAVASFERANITPSVLVSGISAGAEGRGWWRAAQDAIVRSLPAADQPKFAKVLAAFSPQTSVEINTDNAKKLWDWWIKAGRPDMDAYALNEMFKTGLVQAMDTHAPNVARALRGAQLSGPKVAGMDAALQGSPDAMVLDAWMARVTNWAQNTLGGRSVPTGAQTRATSVAIGKGPRGGRRVLPAGRLIEEKIRLPNADYIAFEALVRETAETLRIEPREAQEMLWVYMKSLEPRLVGKPEQLRGVLGESDMAKLLTGSQRTPIQFAGPEADPADLAILERNAQLGQLGRVQRGTLDEDERKAAASIRRNLTPNDIANLQRVGITNYSMALPVAGGVIGAATAEDEGRGMVGGIGTGLLLGLSLGPLTRAADEKLRPFLGGLVKSARAGNPAGATLDIATGRNVPLSRGRYAVGTTSVPLGPNLPPDAIRRAAANAPKGSVLGLWFDHDAQQWYAEASTLTDDLDEAMRLGRQRNQIAIGDRQLYAAGQDGTIPVTQRAAPSAASEAKAAEREFGRTRPAAPLSSRPALPGTPKGPQTAQTLPGHLQPEDWFLLHPEGKPPLP